MQNWFFLEDPHNALLRQTAGEEVQKSEVSVEEKPIYPEAKPWLFKVRVPDLKQDEVVCVTGNVQELGCWNPQRCFRLSKVNGEVWAGSTMIPGRQKVFYRYFVCNAATENTHPVIVVRSWETNTAARIIKRKAASPKPTDEPETYGNYGGKTAIDLGWLIKGAVIKFRMFKHSFAMWRPRYLGRSIHVKVTLVNVVPQSSSCTSLPKPSEESLNSREQYHTPKYSFVTVAKLNSDEYGYRTQEPYGEKLLEDDMIIFEAWVLNPSSTAFLIDLYIYSSKSTDKEPPYLCGFTYLMPSALHESCGSLVLPLTSIKHRPLGEVQLQYLVIRPLPHVACNMSVSYSLHWKQTKFGLDVGHRGSGSSFKLEPKDCSNIRENTIASLKTAINHGADFVEFDVQLSKDLHPVIYHDYYVCMSLQRKKKITERDMLEIPLKALTLEQLGLLKLYHLTEGRLKSPRFYDEDLEDHQPFPTLRSALEALDESAGFNIEVKWDNTFKDGSHECPDAVDLNNFVDRILETVLMFGKGRRVIFSSFNADACTMIRIKQNVYPVMFLTQGETDPTYEDPRCWTFKSGVRFVKMERLLGLNAHSADILREPSLVEYALSSEIILFCWGDDIADADTIACLKKLGLHGIIYDKIDQFIDKGVKEKIYLLEATRSQKEIILAAAQQEIPPPPPQTASPIAVDSNTIDLQQARNADNMSTATSLYSLESDQEQNLIRKNLQNVVQNV